MDARLAELMVRKWQAAKARALGVSHDMAALPEVHKHLDIHLSSFVVHLGNTLASIAYSALQS